MKLNSKYARGDNAKRIARQSGTYRLADGTPINNKPHNIVGEERLSSLVRASLKRGQRRRVAVELHEVAKIVHDDDAQDADVRGKLMPNLISASSCITS